MINKIKIIQNIFFSIFIMIFLSSCAKKEMNLEIADVTNLEQKPYLYIDKEPVIYKKVQNELYDKFLEKYFYPWDLNRTTFTLEDATWGNMYSTMDVYSENHRLISKEWFEETISNSNFEEFGKVAKKAITVTNSQLKVFPTNSKIFFDPKKAGEGFPFDYNENSSIKLNIPLFVSHLSKDGMWAFVESNFSSGWIELKDIAFVNDNFIKIFKNGNYFISTKDDILLYKNGYLIDKANLGTLFPKAKKGYITARRDYKYDAYIRVVDENENLKKLGLDFNLENIKNISSELIGQRYSWGGFLENRDCSLMIKDFYAPFAIYLQRNSAAQKKDGLSIDISHLDNNSKKEFIKDNAIPFLTLIYLKGHIMIYVGIKDDEPLVFHNMWGVKTLEDDGSIGRKVVGKAVVTTLEPGYELAGFSPKKSILSKVESIVFLTK